MVTAEKIEIRELYEFQLFERGSDGEPVPFGEPKRSLQRVTIFEGERHGIEEGRWYAVKRRHITIDEEGNAEFGRWSKLTEWKRPSTSPID